MIWAVGKIVESSALRRLRLPQLGHFLRVQLEGLLIQDRAVSFAGLLEGDDAVTTGLLDVKGVGGQGVDFIAKNLVSGHHARTQKREGGPLTSLPFLALRTA